MDAYSLAWLPGRVRFVVGCLSFAVLVGCAESHLIATVDEAPCREGVGAALGVDDSCVTCYASGGYSLDDRCFRGMELRDLGPGTLPELPVTECAECAEWACGPLIDTCLAEGTTCLDTLSCWELCSTQHDPDALPCEFPICEQFSPVGAQTFGCVLVNCIDRCDRDEFQALRRSLHDRLEGGEGD